MRVLCYEINDGQDCLLEHHCSDASFGLQEAIHQFICETIHDSEVGITSYRVDFHDEDHATLVVDYVDSWVSEFDFVVRD